MGDVSERGWEEGSGGGRRGNDQSESPAYHNTTEPIVILSVSITR